MLAELGRQRDVSVPEWQHEAADVNVRIADIKTTAAAAVNRPVLFSSGWGITLERSQPFANHLADMGRRVVVVDSTQLPSTYQVAKSAALSAAIEQLELEDIDVVGYCEGGINASLMTLDQLERVHSLTLINPAGLTTPEQALRAKAFFNRRLAVKSAEDAKGQAQSPILRSYAARGSLAGAEVSSLIDTDITQAVGQIACAGVKVHILHSVSDVYFPPEYCTVQGLHDNIDYALLADPHAQHSALSTQPQAVATAVMRALDA